MRFWGTHRTTYTYSAPVFLHPHIIRLRPRSDPGQRLDEFAVDIDPTPDGMTEGLDAWGNTVIWAWFSGQHSKLEISTRFVVDRVRVNPFDYIVPTQEGSALPPVYASDEFSALIPYLNADGVGPAVQELAAKIAARSSNVVDFAGDLATEIQARSRMIVRPEGDPMPGEETLALGEGSCRDLAMLYVEACRHVGIAARFASGYVERLGIDGVRDLHAWAGIYLPGGGWRGYDPTQGLAVSNGHVTLAVAASPTGAAPVSGTFLGQGEAHLDTIIKFDVDEN
jgi:transglutaminase-like putative cysteine protease